MATLEQFGILLAETARCWRNRLDQRLKPLGLSQSGWLVLVHLAHSGDGRSQKELAELIGVESPTLVGVLDRLEGNGWIERRVSPTDRRAKGVYRTVKGTEATAEIRRIAAGLRGELLAGLPQEQLLAAMALLEQIKLRAAQL